MDMDKRTLTALQQSIEKWEAIVNGFGNDNGRDNYALCQEFHAKGCMECPVYKKTRNPFCRGTPYAKWEDLHIDKFRYRHACTEEHLQAAQDELEFLRSLLPQEDQ